VSSGLFNDASEVIRETFRLMLKLDEVESLKLELLRSKLQGI